MNRKLDVDAAIAASEQAVRDEHGEHTFVTRADAHDCSVCGLPFSDPSHKRMQSAEDRVRVLRLVEYEGLRAAVERQVAGSIQGTRTFSHNRDTYKTLGSTLRITAVTLGVYPEVVEAGREVAEPRQVAELWAEIARLKDLIPNSDVHCACGHKKAHHGVLGCAVCASCRRVYRAD
jgi:hypothetical protein